MKYFDINYTPENRASMEKHILDFYENERKTRYVDAQIKGDYIKIHADHFVMHE